MNRSKAAFIGLIAVFSILIIYYLISNKQKIDKSFIYQNKYNSISDKLSYVLELINEDYVDPVNIDSLTDGYIASFLQRLDPHSTYLTKEELKKEQESLDGNFEGIGIQFRIIEDTIVVIQPVKKGPSIKAGIMAGDRIVTINDTIRAGKKIDNNDVVRLLKGKKGTKVKLGIKREGIKNLIPFIVRRGVIPTFSVEYYGMIDKKTGYIRLSQFSQTSSQEVRDALKSLLKDNMQQLIFDLRGNGGGYLQQAYQVADEFLSEGNLIVYTEGRNRDRDELIATNEGLFEEGKLIVLIDEFSASASEIVSGAMQDNDRGMIIGRRTFGKGLVQEQRMLPDGSAIRLTIARYYTPSGRCIQRPYPTGDPEGYFNDFIQRYASMVRGEKDTIIHNDSLKYTTKKGRIVYGGGGIEPDVELPYYNYHKSEYYLQLISKGILYKFCFDYVDKNRNSFKKYSTGEKFIQDFQVSESLYEDMRNYAQKNGVEKNIPIGNDKETILEIMKAYIAQGLFEDKYYYSIFLHLDDDVQKALPYFSKIKE